MTYKPDAHQTSFPSKDLLNRANPGSNRREFLCGLGAVAGGMMLAPGMAGSASAAEPSFPDLEAMQAAHALKKAVSPAETYRMMEIALHLPPEGGFEIDLDTVIKKARDAGAESVMFYSQDHWGYAHYTSDVGVRHPHLKGDFFGRAVDLARKQGMSAAAYYSLQFNNQAVFSHPEWGWIDEAGQARRDRWCITCLDTPYRDYAIGMVDEIFSRYEVDELFLDIFGIQFYEFHTNAASPFCFCKSTTEAWNKEHPGDDYREGFKNRDGWMLRYRWHQERSMVNLLDTVLTTARRHRPNMIVALNGGPEFLPNEVQQKVSFLYAEPLDSPTGIALGTVFLRGWGRPNYQAGVFNWRDYIDRNSGSILRVRANAIALQNARTFFVGEAPMVSGLEGGRGYPQRWFDMATEAWQDVRNVDSLFDGIQPVLSSMMLYSIGTQDELAAQKRPTAFRQSMLGALELMTYTGRPVESIPDFRLSPDLLGQFDTLVLPEVEVLTDAQVEQIRQWVRSGGTLVATHRCGMLDGDHKPRANFALGDVFGIDFVSEEQKYAQNYIESAGHPLAKKLALSTVGFPGAFLNVKLNGATEVMRYRTPWMIEDLGKNKWYNWGPPPPGMETNGPAVTLNPFGKGKALYLAFPVFRLLGSQYRARWIRELIPDFLRDLTPNPVIELGVEPRSEFVHGTFFFDKDRRYVLAQVLNTLPVVADGESRPIRGISIRVNPARMEVTGARMVWPKKQDLPLIEQNGKLVVRLPEVDTYAAICLSLARTS